MAEARKNRFAFDREYYYENRINGNQYRTVGTAALAPETEEEEIYELPEQTAPVRKSRRAESVYTGAGREEKNGRNTRREKEEHVVNVRNASFNFVSVFAMLIAILGVVYCSYTFLNTQSDIKQLTKQYKAACAELTDIEAGNEVIAGGLLVANDREYIYNVAVGRLGMVFPDNNTQITYTPVESGYVHQFFAIPE